MGRICPPNLQMPKGYGDLPVDIEEAQQIVQQVHGHDNDAVNQNVLRLVDTGKNQHHVDQPDHNGLNGNEPVILKGLVEPFHHKKVAEYFESQNQIDAPSHLIHGKKHHSAVCGQNHSVHHQVDEEQAGKQLPALLPVVPDPGGLPDAVGVDPEDQGNGHPGLRVGENPVQRRVQGVQDIGADQNGQDQPEKLQGEVIKGVGSNGFSHFPLLSPHPCRVIIPIRREVVGMMVGHLLLRRRRRHIIAVADPQRGVGIRRHRQQNPLKGEILRLSQPFPAEIVLVAEGKGGDVAAHRRVLFQFGVYLLIPPPVNAPLPENPVGHSIQRPRLPAGR